MTLNCIYTVYHIFIVNGCLFVLVYLAAATPASQQFYIYSTFLRILIISSLAT